MAGCTVRVYLTVSDMLPAVPCLPTLSLPSGSSCHVGTPVVILETQTLTVLTLAAVMPGSSTLGCALLWPCSLSLAVSLTIPLPGTIPECNKSLGLFWHAAFSEVLANCVEASFSALCTARLCG